MRVRRGRALGRRFWLVDGGGERGDCSAVTVCGVCGERTALRLALKFEGVGGRGGVDGEA